jgi:hypothetical protein
MCIESHMIQGHWNTTQLGIWLFCSQLQILFSSYSASTEFRPSIHRTGTIKDNQETIIYVLSFWIVIYMFFLCSNQRSNKFTSWQSTHSQLITPKWEKAYLFLPIFNLRMPWFFSVIGGHVMLPSVFFPLLFGGCLEKQNAHSRGCSSVSKCLSYFLFFPHGTQKYLLTDYDGLIWGYRDFRSEHHISKPWKPNPKQQRK